MAEEKKTETKEKPVLESHKSESTAPNPEDKARELLEQLNSLNLDSPEKIQNTFNASQQAGRLAQLLGTEKETVRQLQERMTAMERQQRQPDYTQEGFVGESIDLRKTIQEVMRGEINNYVTSQREAQTAAMREYAGLQSDPDYSLIQQVWEKHVANPNVQMNIQSGNTTLTNEFNKVKIAYYKGIAMNSKDVLQGLINKTTASAKSVHMETGDTSTTPLPDKDTREEALDRIKQQSTGTSDDLDAMIKALIPDTDPFFITAKPTR